MSEPIQMFSRLGYHRWVMDHLDWPNYQRGQPEFYGNATREEAASMLLTGIPAGRIFENELRLAHSPSEMTTSYGILYDTAGPVADLAAYYAGVPECMATPVELLARGDSREPVEVVMNGGTSCSVGTDVIEQRGRLALCLAHLAATSGRPCRVIWCCRTMGKYSKKEVDVAVIVKEWTEPVDYPIMAFVLCHPAMVRRLFCLSVTVQHPDVARDESCGAPLNSNYASMDRVKRIVINHAHWREEMATVAGAIAEATALLKKEEKIC